MNNNTHNRARQWGVAMVEFAILLPLMILILFGITELGRALYQQNTLDKAVNTGARYLARKAEIAEIDEVTGNCVTLLADWDNSAEVTTAKQLVVQGVGDSALLPNLDTGDVSIPAPIQRTIGKYDGDENICVIRVRVDVPFAGLFGDTLIPFTNIGAVTLHAETEERYIGL